jgi:hypothetical protein
MHIRVWATQKTRKSTGPALTWSSEPRSYAKVWYVGDQSVRQNNPTALVAVCLVCVSSAFGLSGRAESSSPYTRFVSNVAGVTRTDMTASGAGTKFVFARFQPSFWVLP